MRAASPTSTDTMFTLFEGIIDALLHVNFCTRHNSGEFQRVLWRMSLTHTLLSASDKTTNKSWETIMYVSPCVITSVCVLLNFSPYITPRKPAHKILQIKDTHTKKCFETCVDSLFKEPQLLCMFLIVNYLKFHRWRMNCFSAMSSLFSVYCRVLEIKAQ